MVARSLSYMHTVGETLNKYSFQHTYSLLCMHALTCDCQMLSHNVPTLWRVTNTVGPCVNPNSFFLGSAQAFKL